MLKTQTIPLDGVSPARIRLTRALMLLVGAIGSFGVLFFTVVQPDNANLDTLGYVIAGLLAIGSVGYISSAVRLGRATDGIWRVSMAFALLRVALSIFKVAYYGETDALVFLVLDVWIAALLSRRSAFVGQPKAQSSSRISHVHVVRRRAA